MEYRFVFYPAAGFTGALPFYGDPMPSQEQAEGQMNIIANYTLHLHDNNLMADFSNVGYLQNRKSNIHDWEDIEEEDL